MLGSGGGRLSTRPRRMIALIYSRPTSTISGYNYPGIPPALPARSSLYPAPFDGPTWKGPFAVNCPPQEKHNSHRRRRHRLLRQESRAEVHLKCMK